MQQAVILRVVLEPDTLISIWRNFSEDLQASNDPRSNLAGTVLGVLVANCSHRLVLNDTADDLARAYLGEFGGVFLSMLNVLPSLIGWRKVSEPVPPTASFTFPDATRHRPFLTAAAAVRPTFLVTGIPEVARNEHIVQQLSNLGVSLKTPQEYILV